MKRKLGTASPGIARRMVLKALAGIAVMPLVVGMAYAQTAKGEAPALAERVKAGQLPPVEERVGDEPAVITPLENVGTHGGELRFGLRGSSDHNHILRMVGPQGLVRWNPEYT
jgi:peptide/nickel transport system substrate-binding protein